VVSLLSIHLWLGALVAALAVLAVWRRRERRVTLYVVTLQILLGIILMVQGLHVSWAHPALAVVAWAGYMGANAAARRSGNRPIELTVAVVASVLILIAFGLGQHAVRAGS
jgi:heme A synthase